MLADGVQMAARGLGGGQREVDPLGLQARLGGRRFKGRLAGLERRLEPLLHGVEQLTDAGALLGRQLAELLADVRQRSLAAQHLDTHAFELAGGGRRFDGSRVRASNSDKVVSNMIGKLPILAARSREAGARLIRPESDCHGGRGAIECLVAPRRRGDGGRLRCGGCG